MLPWPFRGALRERLHAVRSTLLTIGTFVVMNFIADRIWKVGFDLNIAWLMIGLFALGSFVAPSVEKYAPRKSTGTASNLSGKIG